MIATRKDRDHKKAITIFQSYGWGVIDTSSFLGKMLDLFIDKPNLNLYHFVEIKTGKGKKLTTAEDDFFTKHPEKSIRFNSLEEISSWCASELAGRKF